LLEIAAPLVTNFEPFSGSLLYVNAKPIQADDGSGRGPARGLLRWAKVSVGSGDRRRRASSARGPSPTSFGVLGLTRARQSILARQQGRLARRRQKSGRGRYCGARHTPHPPFLTHARSLATHRRCGVDGAPARGRWVAGAAERGVSVGCVRRDGDGAGGGSSDAGRALEGDDGVEQWSSTAAGDDGG